jgi:hypothetical protein
VTPEHDVLHVPQVVADARFASHPFDAIPSQSENPAAHTKLHDPTVHVEIPFEGALHDVPHAPQFAALVARLASHPFAGFRSQSSNPGAQLVIVHAPAVHTAFAFARLHAFPHRPQFAGSEARDASHPSTMLPLQSW